MGFIHDILFEATAEQFEKDLKEAYGMGFRDGRLCPADLRPCEVDGKPALFHRWAEEDKGVLKINAFVKREQFEDLVSMYREESVVPGSCDVTVMRTTFAIVEYPDGSVHRVPVDRVRFTDRRTDE